MRMEDPFNVYVTGQNYIQVKIWNLDLLTLNLLCFLALIIHELGLGDRKLRNKLGSNILTWI